jgi:thymidylate kinase
MDKLIVLEGPDGVGKTTQAKRVAEKLRGKFMIQPSDSNAVAFLRKEVKENMDYSPLERQLLHTISHIVDAHDIEKLFNFDASVEEIRDNILIMDRCHASAYVYGALQKMKVGPCELILKIHQKVYEKVLQHYQIHIVFMDRDERYSRDENDAFEKSLDWNNLNTLYRGFYERMRQNEITLFHPKERLHRVELFDLGPDDVTKQILDLIKSTDF